MKAFLKNYRQSPRKVRLVTDMVRGKRVEVALMQLAFLPKRSSGPIAKLITSAVANAKNNFNVDPAGLYIKSITVDQGTTLKRMMPRSRGMAHPINKRSSHVSVILAEKGKNTTQSASSQISSETKSSKVTKTEKKPEKMVKKVAGVKKSAPVKKTVKKVSSRAVVAKKTVKKSASAK